MNLLDLWRGRLTLRRLRVLLDYLPGDSHTARAMADLDPDDPLSQWGLGDLLLARLVDEVSAHRWQWESYHSKRPSRRAPQSVLPERTTKQLAASSDANVIVMSPHQLGSFVNEQEEGA